eukprot:SAG11_NODE_5231_length_1622_cov_1.384767_1_plen_53_part_00
MNRNPQAAALREKAATYDVAPAPAPKAKASGKKKAASHKLESEDDFPTLGGN